MKHIPERRFERRRFSILDILSNRTVDGQRAEILSRMDVPAFAHLRDLPLGRAMLEACEWMRETYGDGWVARFQEAMERTGIRTLEACPPSGDDLAWLAETSASVPDGVPAGYESLVGPLAELGRLSLLPEVAYRLGVPRGALPHEHAPPIVQARLFLDWAARKGTPPEAVEAAIRESVPAARK